MISSTSRSNFFIVSSLISALSESINHVNSSFFIPFRYASDISNPIEPNDYDSADEDLHDTEKAEQGAIEPDTAIVISDDE